MRTKPAQQRLISNSNFKKVLLALPLCTTLLLTACSQEGEQPQDNSEQAQIYVLRANAYTEQGQFKAAIIEARNALQANPNDLNAYISMARVYNRLGQSSQTIAILEPLATKEGFSGEAKLQLLEAYIKHGKAESARSLLRQIKPSKKNSKAVALQKIQLANLEKNFDRAQQLLTPLLQAEPNNPELKVIKAKIFSYSGNLSQATIEAQSILAQHPNFEPALTLMALISYQAKDLEATEDYLSNALINLPSTDLITPEKARILKRLTHVLSSLGRANEALIYAKVLSDAAPEQKALEEKFAQAMTAYKAGELEKAKLILEELHRKASDKSATGTLLGSINFQQGNIDQAADYLQKFVDPEIATDKAINLLALTQLRQGKFDKAIELLETELKDSGDDAALLSLLAAAQLGLNDSNNAKQNLNKALKIDSKQALAYELLARIEAQTNGTEAAIEVLQQGIEATDYKTKLVNLLLQNYEAQKAFDKTLSFTEQLINAKPKQSSSYLLHAFAAVQNKQVDKAKRSLNKAIELDADNGEAYMTLAKINFSQGDFSQAQNNFAKAIEKRPALQPAYDGLLASYKRQQQAEQGIKSLNKLLDQDPKYVLATIALSKEFAAQNQHQQAQSYIEQALTIAPQNAQIKGFASAYFLSRAKQLSNAREYAQVRETLIKGLSSTPDSLPLLAELALNEANSGEKSEAVKILQRIKERSQNQTAINLISGDVYQALKDDAQALSFYQQAWQLNKSDSTGQKLFISMGRNKQNTASFVNDWLDAVPNSVNAHLNKAIAAQSQQQADMAKRWYQKTLKLAPNHVIALNNLAWLLFEQQDKQAIPLAEKAYQLSRQAPAVADTYGWILVNQGQKAKGIEILEQAAAQAPTNKDIQQHLAEARKL